MLKPQISEVPRFILDIRGHLQMWDSNTVNKLVSFWGGGGGGKNLLKIRWLFYLISLPEPLLLKRPPESKPDLWTKIAQKLLGIRFPFFCRHRNISNQELVYGLCLKKLLFLFFFHFNKTKQIGHPGLLVVNLSCVAVITTTKVS